ncbi:MAG: hypothetical protein IJY14_03755 [Acholeplasmatales bacterium]|nr:hypothetical protein [Acholeplasmatales bacterium]
MFKRCFKVISFMILFICFMINSFNIIASYNDNNLNTTIQPRWWFNYYRGYITLYESNATISYGNYDDISAYYHDNNCHDIAIMNSSGPISASSSIEILEFEVEEVSDSINGEIAIVHVKNVDKLPVGSYEITVTSGQKVVGSDVYLQANTLYTLNVEPLEINIEYTEDDLILNYIGAHLAPQPSIIKDINGNMVEDDDLNIIYNEDNNITIGNHSATITGVNNDNYILNSECINTSISYYIDRPKLSINIDDINITYGDSVNISDVTYTYEGLIIGDNIDDYINQDNISINIGYNQYDSIYDNNGDKINYYIEMSYEGFDGGDSETGYILEINNGRINISPVSVYVEWEEAELIYNGLNQSIDYNLYTINNEERIYLDNLKLEIDNIDTIHAGNYSININGLNNSNYQLVDCPDTLDFEILKAPIYIRPNDLDITYGDKLDFAKFGYSYEIGTTIEGLTNAEIFDYYVKINELSYKSTYDYLDPVFDDSNSLITYTLEFSNNSFEINPALEYQDFDIVYRYNSFTVNPRLIDINTSVNKIKYNGLEREFYPTLINSAPLADPGLIIDGNIATNVGIYECHITGLTNVNYILAQDSYSFYWEIEKGDLSFSINDLEITYDGTPHMLYVNEDIPNGVTVHYYCNDELFDGAKDAGTYNIIAKFDVDDNYNSVDSIDAVLVIKPIEITVSFSGYENLSFKDMQQAIDVQFNGNIIDGDSLNPIISGNTGTNAGNYTCTVEGLGNNNYVLVGSVTQNWGINKGEVPDFEISDDNVIYNGESYKIKDELPEGVIDIEYGYILDGEEVEEAVDAGEYKVIVDYIVDENYEDIESDEIIVIINPQEVTVKFDSFSGFIYNGQIQEIDIVFEGVAENDKNTVKPIITGNSGKDAGTYKCVVSGIESKNYYLAQDEYSFDWVISPKDITVEFDYNNDIIYDGNNHEININLIGVVDGDDIQYTASGISGLKAREYECVIGTISNKNYVISGVTALKWEIKPKKAYIEFSNYNNIIYNKMEQGINIKVNGIINNDIVNPIASNFKGINAGEYECIVTGLDNSDYVLAEEKYTQKWIINKADINDFSLPDVSRDYTGIEYIYNISHIDGIVDFELTYYKNNEVVDKAIDAGTYTVVAEFTVDSNYNEIKPKESKLRINPKNIDITFNNKIVNGKINSVTAIVTGYGDPIEIEIPIEEIDNKDEYIFNALGLSKDNYQLDDVVNNDVIQSEKDNSYIGYIVGISIALVLCLGIGIFAYKRKKIH